MTIEEDCCHSEVEVRDDHIVAFDVDEVTIEVYELCLVCNDIVEVYQVTYRAE